jgi:hypothetical protein
MVTLTLLFWTALVADAVLLVVLVALSLAGGGGHDGGREMAIVFSIVVPAVIVAAGALLFLWSTSNALRAVGLLIVAGPGLIVAGARLRSAYIDYRVRQNALGSGYFSTREVKRAAEAVVRRDAAALRAFDRTLDVNEKGTSGMTLVELAVTQAFERPDAGGSTATIDVLKELITRGADPNPGVAVATKLPDPAALTLLLDHGAKAGGAGDHGPVVFEWLDVTPPGNVTILLDHQLDPNILDAFGTPLVMAAAQNDRWDLVLLLLDRGANPDQGDRQGSRLSDVVQSRVESLASRPPETQAAIARVRARLAK